MFPTDFLWGASTSAHQTEGGNTASDRWAFEHAPFHPVVEPSGDACDSYARFEEDIRLLADSGLNAYRFSLEWARIEPEPGEFSTAQILHYRRIIETCQRYRVTPVVTLHHFSSPLWFTKRGGWARDDSPSLFARYTRRVSPILSGVPWIVTINEPNLLARCRVRYEHGTFATAPYEIPDSTVTRHLIAAHKAAREVLGEDLSGTVTKTGWSIACMNYQSADGRPLSSEFTGPREDTFTQAGTDDDFIGVQTYTRTVIGLDGQPISPTGHTTLTGWEYYPQSLEDAVRHVWRLTDSTPILVTENGIATNDDTERISYTLHAIQGLERAIGDGIRVHGYLHWSLLDNYEWGSYSPTFGLVAVDRDTFERHPKPSLDRLGAIAKNNRIV